MPSLESDPHAILAIIPGPGLLFALMLVAAIVGGYTVRLVRVPRVVGFLIAGALLRVLLFAVLDLEKGGAGYVAMEAAVEPLKAIKDLALGLILFTIGGVFERSKFRSIGSSLWKISAWEISLVTLLVFVGCAIATLATDRTAGVGQNLVLSVLLAAAGIATAPAATLFVLREYQAKGPITDTILGLTGVNNIVCIVLFFVMFLMLVMLGGITPAQGVADRTLLAILLTTVGSVALGIVSGTFISILHAKLPLAEVLLVFFALFILLGAGEKWLWEHVGVAYNFLLTALITGGIFANVAIDAQKLESTLHTMGSPIFAGFFVMAGYGLHLEDLGHMGWLGGTYVAARSLGKIVGCRIGTRWAGAPLRENGRLGSAMLCQAAVVIGLAAFIEQSWDSPLAAKFSTIILGSVVLFELIGPLMVKRCVVLGGEVKAVTLLRRPTSAVEGGSVVHATLQSLLRVFGLGGVHAPSSSSSMQVKHIMRTNVHFIRASAGLDEVLHFIERSTYNHFPVVDDEGVFVGVIHFGDVRDVIYDPTLRELVTAVDLADPDSAAAPVDLTLPELLTMFNEQNVGVLPVVSSADARRILGIVEQRDLLRMLHRRESR